MECKYCTGENDSRDMLTKHKNENHINMFIDSPNKLTAIYHDGKPLISEDKMREITINYCPMCGRKF